MFNRCFGGKAPAPTSFSALPHPVPATMVTTSAVPVSSALAHAVSSLGFRLLEKQLQEAGSDSAGTFLSPLSIYYALALALNGAGPGSDTHSQLLKLLAPTAFASGQASEESALNQQLSVLGTLLNSATDSQDAPTLTLANSLWVGPGFELLEEYKASMLSLFGATAATATNGPDDVNQWVSKVTRGVIPQLIPPNTPFDAVLANAIYFKGLWEHEFSKDSTRPSNFTMGNGRTKQHPFMNKTFQHGERLMGYSHPTAYDLISLPYKGGQFSALVVLPKKGVSREKVLAAWSENSSPKELSPLGKVFVSMPKFKVDSSMTLEKMLQALGVADAFSLKLADFGRLSAVPLYISSVIHKAVVEVDEAGTVAAAATAIKMRKRSAPRPETPPQQFIVDRPFLFVLVTEQQQLPLFSGWVQEPCVDS